MTADGIGLPLQADPTPEDERREPVASGFPQGPGPLRMFDGRRVDAEQSHAPDRRDLDGVTIDDGVDQDGVGAFEAAGQ